MPWFLKDENDDHYYYANVPKGWKVKYSNVGWFEVVDDQERVRGEVCFEKTVFDKENFVPCMSLYSRYGVYCWNFMHPFVAMEVDRVRFGNKSEYKEIGITQIFKEEGSIFLNGEDYCKLSNCEELNKIYCELLNELRHKAELYGDEHFPNWRDVHAYWDDEKILSSGNSK